MADHMGLIFSLVQNKETEQKNFNLSTDSDLLGIKLNNNFMLYLKNEHLRSKQILGEKGKISYQELFVKQRTLTATI